MYKETFRADEVFFTSDTHYGHENILGYCDRPFKSIGRHDSELYRRACDIVGENHVLIHLGDFAFERGDRARELVDLMPGAKKILIAGNHDGSDVLKAEGWDLVIPYLELELSRDEGKSRKVVLCHYPMEIWNGSHHGAWHLHGHCHGKLPAALGRKGGARLDVGVDCWDFRPVSCQDIECRLKAIRSGELDGRAPWAVAAGRFETRTS